ncbi:Hsp20/alpha crystallin family protein, partial [Singulisphaera rosea]
MIPMPKNNHAFNPITMAPINRLDSLLGRMFGEDAPHVVQAMPGTSQSVAAWEDDERVYVEADLPGVAPQDLEVTV